MAFSAAHTPAKIADVTKLLLLNKARVTHVLRYIPPSLRSMAFDVELAPYEINLLLLLLLLMAVPRP